MVVMLVQALQLKIGADARAAVAVAVNRGYMKGMGGNTFSPEGTSTRGPSSHGACPRTARSPIGIASRPDATMTQPLSLRDSGCCVLGRKGSAIASNLDAVERRLIEKSREFEKHFDEY